MFSLSFESSRLKAMWKIVSLKVSFMCSAMSWSTSVTSSHLDLFSRAKTPCKVEGLCHVNCYPNMCICYTSMSGYRVNCFHSALVSKFHFMEWNTNFKAPVSRLDTNLRASAFHGLASPSKLSTLDPWHDRLLTPAVSHGPRC